MPLSIYNAFQLRLEEEREILRDSLVAIFPEDYFFIKSLRADLYNYIREFVASIVIPNKKVVLRIGDKKKYTVTGLGIFARSRQFSSPDIPLKQPQYTKDEKHGYSNFQSTSMGTSDFFPKVFGFHQDRMLAGVILNRENVLLTHRLMIYDEGSVARPYEFELLKDAEEYAQAQIGKNLFSLDDINAYEKAIKKEEHLYNEALVRIRGTADEGLRVFVGEDTLLARLLAQEYARIIKNSLLHANLCSSNYCVSIIYYLPENNALNFKSYTQAEQKIDYLQARLIFENKAQFKQAIANQHYVLLFVLAADEILALFSNDGGTIPLQLINEGYFYIFLALLEKLDNVGMKAVYQFFILQHQKDKTFIPTLYISLSNSHDKKHPLLLNMIYKLLRQKCIDFSYKDSGFRTALMHAVLNNDIESLTLMLEHPVDVDSAMDDGATLLYSAVENGYIDITKLLLKYNADINKPMEGGFTPLYAAAEYGHIEIVKCLLEHKAKVDKATDSGVTPLFIASQAGDFNVVNLLLQYDADVHKTIDSGAAPLHAAAEYGDINLVDLLLKHKADINHSTHGGATPLSIAIEEGHIELVSYLQENGANMTRKNHRNYF